MIWKSTIWTDLEFRKIVQCLGQGASQSTMSRYGIRRGFLPNCSHIGDTNSESREQFPGHMHCFECMVHWANHGQGTPEEFLSKAETTIMIDVSDCHGVVYNCLMLGKDCPLFQLGNIFWYQTTAQHTPSVPMWHHSTPTRDMSVCGDSLALLLSRPFWEKNALCVQKARFQAPLVEIRASRVPGWME